MEWLRHDVVKSDSFSLPLSFHLLRCEDESVTVGRTDGRIDHLIKMLGGNHLASQRYLLEHLFARKCWFPLFLTKTWRTDGRTDGRTYPLIEMQGRIQKSHIEYSKHLLALCWDSPTTTQSTTVFTTAALVPPLLPPNELCQQDEWWRSKVVRETNL